MSTGISNLIERVILEGKTARNETLWIAECSEPGHTTLYLLDCEFDNRGKQFLELPRFYRTERGAKNAGTRIAGEKMKWSKP